MQTTLRSFIIPFRGGQSVLPGSSMIEVLPFATPLTLEGAPGWVVGSMLWRACNVPLVDLGCLVYQANPDMEAHSRIVMVKPIAQSQAIPYLGLLGIDAPRLLNLDRTQIVESEVPAALLEIALGQEEASFGVLRWVKINQQPAIIPDLSAIVERLAPLVRRPDV